MESGVKQEERALVKQMAAATIDESSLDHWSRHLEGFRTEIKRRDRTKR